MRLDSFNEVVSRYERTKPVVSKNHTPAHDVRPISERDRKWERIKKIDENTYALCDGNYGNIIYGLNHSNMEHAYENSMAPIVWMRRQDGDFIRIRNHSKGHSSVTRYNFLRYTLPLGLRFRYNTQGKHWVEARVRMGEYEFYPLPKCGVHMNYTTKKFTDDDVYLMFRSNGDGTYTRVGKNLVTEVRRVDRDLKQQWKPRIDAFYEYCAAIAPLVDTSWSSRHEYANQIAEWEGTPTMRYIRDTRAVPVDIVRDIITKEDHPLRVALVALVLYDIRGKRVIDTKEDIRSIKAAYNRLMNAALGCYKTEEK